MEYRVTCQNAPDEFENELIQYEVKLSGKRPKRKELSTIKIATYLRMVGQKANETYKR